MPTAIKELTAEQAAQMPAWADKWIEIGLRTGEADWQTFEEGARECYHFAKIPWPGVVVRVPSPLVLALAAPAAAVAIELRDKGETPSAADMKQLVQNATRKNWTNYLGGQLWIGGWHWGGAWTSFFREVCHLELPGDLWARGLAYEKTMRSACWWYPHRRFVMVSNRPTVINLELADPKRPRGWRSHRLHSADGPAIAWPDGWSLWYWHGVRVTEKVILRPQTISIADIDAEDNAEVRRALIERYGPARYIKDSGTKLIHQDRRGTLYRRELKDDEPLLMLKVVNTTPEPDGSSKDYWLRVHPELRPMNRDENGEPVYGDPQTLTAHNAAASIVGLRGEDYHPDFES